MINIRMQIVNLLLTVELPICDTCTSKYLICINDYDKNVMTTINSQIIKNEVIALLPQ